MTKSPLCSRDLRQTNSKTETYSQDPSSSHTVKPQHPPLPLGDYVAIFQAQFQWFSHLDQGQPTEIVCGSMKNFFYLKLLLPANVVLQAHEAEWVKTDWGATRTI